MSRPTSKAQLLVQMKDEHAALVADLDNLTPQ